MCANFELSFDNDINELKQLSKQLKEKYGDAAKPAAGGQYFPKMEAPVVGPNGNASLLFWGFPRDGSKNVIFNARGENISQRPAFIDYLANRCLVPATSFFEWDSLKQKYRVTFTEFPFFYLAALWRPVRRQDGSKYFCFVIITTEPNNEIGAIHDRMPVVVEPDKAELWFSSNSVQSLLSPFSRGTIMRKA